MHTVYFGLGTNLGNKEENIRNALNILEKRIGQVIACSAFYITAPVGFESDNQFLNAACEIQTLLSPLEVLYISQKIEQEMGRTSKSVNGKHEDRIMDIDLLMYDDLIMDVPDLKLPHPHLHKREFVIVPLAEIASNVVHPVLEKTLDSLRGELLEGG